MTQEVLFGAPEPQRVLAPVPGRRPAWMKPGRRREHCAHCVLVAAQQDPEPVFVRDAVTVRVGTLGSTTPLCAGHAQMQRETDRTRYAG